MAHLEHVSVEGFKKIEQLSLDVGQFTVVTGRNNSGKSSLLEAAFLCSNPNSVSDEIKSSPEIVHYDYESALVHGTTAQSNWEVEISLPNSKQIRLYVAEALQPFIETQLLSIFEGHNKFISKIINKNIRKVVSDSISVIDDNFSEEFIEMRVGEEVYPYLRESSDVLEKVSNKTLADMENRIVEQGLKNERVPKHYQSLQQYTSVSSLENSFVVGKPDIKTPSIFLENQLNIQNSGDGNSSNSTQQAKVGDFLREKQIVDNLKTFTLDSLVFEPDDGEKYSVPFDQMGEGFRAIVGLLWELLDDDLPEVVFLEEPSTHMHPGYVRELVYFLVDLAREEDVQVFLTTHDSDLLNDLFTDNLTEEEVSFLESEFRLVQMQDGTADVMEYREAEHTLEELMLDLRGI